MKIMMRALCAFRDGETEIRARGAFTTSPAMAKHMLEAGLAELVTRTDASAIVILLSPDVPMDKRPIRLLPPGLKR